jgi:sarcosine oxidase subunit beta
VAIPLSAQPSPDAVIVGAGVLGCAIAFELTRRGCETLNVDRLAAAGHGSTGSSSAIVRGHYSTHDAVALAYESAERWRRWPDYLDADDESGHAQLVQRGSVLLKSSERHYAKVIPLYDEIGVPYVDWSVDELALAMPMLDVRSFGPPRRLTEPEFWHEPEHLLDGALFTPWSGYVNDPQLAAHNLQRAAEAHGGRFAFRQTLTDILVERGQVRGICLDDGSVVRTPIVVNVAGPHSAHVNRLAGADADMRVRTRPLRHEVHHLPAPPGVDFERDGLHVSDADLGIDFRPEAGNNISVGSEGPACDPKDWIDDPDDFKRHVTEAVWETQVFRLARRLPALRIPVARKGVADLYDVSDDWMPIYDRSAVEGFYMAVGTSGNQFKNAPMVGELMAELITRCSLGHDHDTDPVRIAGDSTGATINLGSFSRLRDLDRRTSLSAMG